MVYNTIPTKYSITKKVTELPEIFSVPKMIILESDPKLCQSGLIMVTISL